MNLKELEEPLHNQGLNPFYVSFSDLMVLLCVFFVMLVGMSRIEIGSFEKLKMGFTGSKEGTLVELAENLNTIARQKEGVSVRLAEDGVRLDLESAALFASGSPVLKPGSLEPLKPLLQEILKTNYQIDIEGHTDDVSFYRKEGQEIETNWSLSGRRASSVVHFLLDMGFTPSRLRIIGYASTKPKVPIKGKKDRNLARSRAQNRRVSILVR